MPKGKKSKKNKKRHNRRANGFKNPFSTSEERKMLNSVEIMLRHNGIKRLTSELLDTGHYDFTFEPDKDYSNNRDILSVCELLIYYMDIKRIGRIILDIPHDAEHDAATA